MSEYAYADIDAFKEPLIIFTRGPVRPGAVLSDKGVAHTILMSRTDFTVKILEIPPLPEDQVASMLSYRIKSLHPGDPARTSFDYRIITRNGQQFAVLFITSTAVRDSYRHLGERNLLILPFHLMKRDILAGDRDQACFLFWHRHWIDMFAVKEGKPAASAVIKRTASLKHDLHKIMKLLAPGPSPAAFTIYCDQNEEDVLREGLAAAGAGEDLRFVSFEECLRREVHRKDALFPLRQPFTLPPLKLRLAVYGAAAALLAVALFFRLVDHQYAYRDKLKAIETSLAEKNKGLAARLKETRNLEQEYTGLRSRKPVDLGLLLAELSSAFPPDTVIRSIVVKGNAFQLDGTGGQPLSVEERLKTHPLFAGLEITEMKPDPGSGRQMFRMKGLFFNEKTHD